MKKKLFIVNFVLLICFINILEVSGQSDTIDSEIHRLSKQKFDSLNSFNQFPFINRCFDKLNLKNGIVYITNFNEGNYIFGVVLYLNDQHNVTDVCIIKLSVADSIFEYKKPKLKAAKKFKKLEIKINDNDEFYGILERTHHNELEIIFSVKNEKIIGGLISNLLIPSNAILKNSYYILITKIVSISNNKW